tara:strand:- start:63 stop:497 length:435 start_codon:yes stop_codon:yes gene_type:complete
MERLEVTVVNGSVSGIDPDILQHIVDAAHRGEDVLVSVNHEGVLSERVLSDEEKELLKEKHNAATSIEPSTPNTGLPVAIVGHRGHTTEEYEALRVAVAGIAPASYDLNRLMPEYCCVKTKTEPFRGRQRKQIPPRNLKVQRRR